MKLLYIVNARIPTEKAHGFQIMKMCEAFSSQGVEVELVVPLRRTHLKQDAFSFYGLRETFGITYLQVPDLVRFGRIGFYLQTTMFALRVLFYGLRSNATIIYSRDSAVIFLLSFFRKVVLEVHNIPDRFLDIYAFALKKIYKIVSTNIWKKDFLLEHCRVSSERVFVFPNGIDLESFGLHEDRKALCKRFGLLEGLKYVVYTGHLYEWKGAHVLAQAARVLGKGVCVIFVGGSQTDIASFSSKYGCDQLIFVGQKPHEAIADYLALANAVVLPNVPTTRESVYATSPMKLFEYMAAKKPIIASDLPSIREIIDDSCAQLFEAGNVEELAKSISAVLENDTYAEEISNCAYERAKKYTWQQRGAQIVEFISS